MNLEEITFSNNRSHMKNSSTSLPRPSAHSKAKSHFTSSVNLANIKIHKIDH